MRPRGQKLPRLGAAPGSGHVGSVLGNPRFDRQARPGHLPLRRQHLLRRGPLRRRHPAGDRLRHRRPRPGAGPDAGAARRHRRLAADQPHPLGPHPGLSLLRPLLRPWPHLGRLRPQRPLGKPAQRALRPDAARLLPRHPRAVRRHDPLPRPARGHLPDRGRDDHDPPAQPSRPHPGLPAPGGRGHGHLLLRPRTPRARTGQRHRSALRPGPALRRVHRGGRPGDPRRPVHGPGVPGQARLGPQLGGVRGAHLRGGRGGPAGAHPPRPAAQRRDHRPDPGWCARRSGRAGRPLEVLAASEGLVLRTTPAHPRPQPARLRPKLGPKRGRRPDPGPSVAIPAAPRPWSG